jgi:hypothetical protein
MQKILSFIEPEMMFKFLSMAFSLLAIWALVNGALLAGAWALAWAWFCSYASRQFAKKTTSDIQPESAD